MHTYVYKAYVRVQEVLEETEEDEEEQEAQIITSPVNVNEPLRGRRIDLKHLARRHSDWGVQGPIAIPRTGTASPKLARDVRQVTDLLRAHLYPHAHIYARMRTYILTRVHI